VSCVPAGPPKLCCRATIMRAIVQPAPEALQHGLTCGGLVAVHSSAEARSNLALRCPAPLSRYRAAHRLHQPPVPRMAFQTAAVRWLLLIRAEDIQEIKLQTFGQKAACMTKSLSRA